ncbi:MAG TPA: hypothetical protein PLP23_00165 [Panacibacter sp.]|nr:hypothetical protein [Panacibacter sp.]
MYSHVTRGWNRIYKGTASSTDTCIRMISLTDTEGKNKHHIVQLL